MKLNARNVIKGKVVEVTRGTTTAHVKIDIGGGTVLTASKKGDAAYAVIKASDVIVARD